MKPMTQLVVFLSLFSPTLWAQTAPPTAQPAGSGVVVFGQAGRPGGLPGVSQQPGAGSGVVAIGQDRQAIPGIPQRPPPPSAPLPGGRVTRLSEVRNAPQSAEEGTVSVGKPEGGPLKRQRTYSSLDAPDRNSDKEIFPANSISLEQADLGQVFKIYEDISGRTMIASPNLPPSRVTIRPKTALLRREVLQAFDTVLAQHGITIIPVGTEFVKAVPASQAGTEAGPVVTLPRDQLPESDSYMTYIVEVKNVLPREVAPAIQPFAKMPGSSIMAIDSGGLLVLRDYSNNIRRMLLMIERLDDPNAPPVPPRPAPAPRPGPKH